ncbi:MAG: Helix-turn-helix domain protein [bacterium ADurb.Bin400]|nr:MAG: Helix-turn-helix domain protein [bacterium ADurb.Bin400]
MQQEEFISTTRAAEILGLNRTQVFRLIKAGKIPATRIGRNFAIKMSDLGVMAGKPNHKDRQAVAQTVKRVLEEYGDVIRQLGEE